jgi:hypothetical protein
MDDAICSKKCLFCTKNSIEKCSKCKTVYSPCQICETTDWFIHKSNSCTCETLNNEQPQGFYKQVYGILLPENSEKPVLIQIKVENKYYSQCYFDLPDLKEFMGECSLRSNQMPTNPMKNYKGLPQPLEFNFRDNFFNDGSKTNMLVKNLTNNKNPHNWKGPMVIMKFKILNKYIPDPVYIDASFDDLPNLIDYLLWY